MGCSCFKSRILDPRTILCFQDRDRCRTSGRYDDPFQDRADKKGIFEETTDYVFRQVLEERKAIIAARLKFREMDVNTIKQKYPHWTEDMIMDLKAQFQTLDLNLDGLIDFHDMCNILDELGDTSDEEARRRYFQELDEDGSGAIDFEEYLAVIDSVMTGKQKLNLIGQLSTVGSENAQKVRKLSVVQQIDNGLF